MNQPFGLAAVSGRLGLHIEFYGAQVDASIFCPVGQFHDARHIAARQNLSPSRTGARFAQVRWPIMR